MSPTSFLPEKLQELGLRYMVSGSGAAIFYGEPRLTNDVDIIVVLHREDVERLQANFPDSEFYCPPKEVILSELARPQRGHINIIHHQTGFKADVYLTSRDPLHAWGLSRSVEIDLVARSFVLRQPNT